MSGLKGITKSYIGTVCGAYRRCHTEFSQEDVAEELGIDRSTISKFERGTTQSAFVFLWYVAHGIFEWKPIETWNGWGAEL
jgi:response regulator of citrate/malate metabolism